MAVASLSVPRESVELVRLTALADGVATSNYLVSVVAANARPLVWSAPTVVSNGSGYLTGTLPVGNYSVWVKITSTPEVPVIMAARLAIT